MLSSQSKEIHKFFAQLIVAATTLMVFAKYFFSMGTVGNWECSSFNGRSDEITMTVPLFSGEFDDTEVDGWEQTLEVSDIFVHPDYNNHDIDYDFTLIKLAKPVELNDHVAPACFPSEEDDLASTFPPG